MTFAVGDKVVYPHHGAAIIEGKEKRVFDGQKTDYFVLRITYGDLKVSIPVDKADEIGLREVINDEEVEEVFAVLRKKEARMPTNWSRRFKNHVEKLKSGDIYQVAEVVRNLSIREADKGLSAGEKRMLARARQILVSELTFALNVDEEAAEARLDDVLAGRDVPPPPKKKAAPVKKPPAVKKAPAEKAPAAAKAKEPAAKATPAKKAAPVKAAAKTTKSAAK
jgi:CarD family transcriptional regulator